MRVVAVVQARMGSTRFPGKVMQPVRGTPMIGILLQRLARARRVHEIVVATSVDPRNAPLAEYVCGLGYAVHEGSENDVLGRYYDAAREARADVVIRVTGDCPLIDPGVVDQVVERFLAGGLDYVSNVAPPTYPDGLDTEVFSFAALARAHREARAPHEREHVTPYLREQPSFRRANVTAPADESAQRWTVDEPTDYKVIHRIFEHFDPRRDFTWEEVVTLSKTKPELFAANKNLERNAGSAMGTGQKLWKRAKQVIPGGNMLLSKRAEMYLPDHWPAYFQRTEGCRVWDLDGNAYVDATAMSIGANTLGYSHPEVDAAVRGVIDLGNMSTLNCPEEVYLAEKLIEMHPWADMARFARSGGEANAIAIRIARAASGKDKVAFCGYHGWHDWYLAANLGDEKTLAGHLLPGLEPRGVPQNLRDTMYPFGYNRFDELEAIVRAHDIGVIKMEVMRNQGPEPGFLESVRKLATDRGIVLIFDECTSGFRQSFGGLHKLYGVEPDMAMFGKALGNGYAITGTIGRREVMEAAQGTFISSTFWTERIGPTAALKTLEVMERVKSWETITATGRDVMGRWKELAQRHGLPLQTSGLPALASFAFPSQDMLKYKTLITQEMLKKGYLATNLLYLSIAHTPEIIDAYIDALDPIFGLIAQCEAATRKIDDLLEGPVCHAGFKRLN